MISSLSISNHDRDVTGLKYIYPVISRRAGGLSIGINFNTNNACNWRCVYCQVPNLIKGVAPALDFQLLEDELRLFLHDIQRGGFYRRFQIETEQQAIKDIAISGNGEPTSVEHFARAVALIGDIAVEMNVFPDSHFVLITNGSLMHQKNAQEGLKVLNEFGGEVWYKFDSATKKGRAEFNGATQNLSKALENIKISSALCPTKLQTCWFDFAGRGLQENEKQAFLDALKMIGETTDVNEILLYTLARPSMQPDASRLKPLSNAVLNSFADEIRSLGFHVSVAG